MAITFDLTLPRTVQEAVEDKADGARWLAGGTDLIPEWKTDLVLAGNDGATPRWVNLKLIDALRAIETAGDYIRIGALTTLAELAASDMIRRDYRALAQVCELAASPQIRNVATIGGNLCQD